MIFKDQMNRTIRLEAIPKRIVSLVPSQTEFLFDLGLENEVVGITKFCVHPEEWFRSKTRIGGTKTVNIEKVKLLNPDLIIANKEENTQADIEALKKIAPVWISDISTLSDAFEMMQLVRCCFKIFFTNLQAIFSTVLTNRNRH
jgi:ABC-type Fe3+-hydroxamate transport system substrate-binding protein